MKLFRVLWACVFAALALMATTARAADFPATQVMFDSGSAALSAQAQGGIAAAASFLKENKDTKVQLSGFVDSTGPADVNKELAKQRALAVREAIKAAGIAEDRIVLQKPDDITAGKGEESRRVDIALYVAAPAAAAAAAAPADAAPAEAAPEPAPLPAPDTNTTTGANP